MITGKRGFLYVLAAAGLLISLLFSSGCNASLMDDQFTEKDLEGVDTICKDASAEYDAILAETGNADTARQELAAYLQSRRGVIDAGVAEDDATVWAHFKPGITACILTEWKKPDDEGRSVLPAAVPRRSFRQNTAVPRNGAGTQHEKRFLGTGAGMTARLFSPFNSEFGITDELMLFKDYYVTPGLEGYGLDDAFTYIDFESRIDEVMAALVPTNGPAMHLLMNTHGGLTKLHTNGEVVNHICTGEHLIPADAYAEYKTDIQEGRIVLSYVDSVSYLAFTPEFVWDYSTFSGTVDEEDSDWLVRYVHINACYSYHQSLVDAFLETGAVCFSGFTGTVTCEYGNYAGQEFFSNLADCHTIQESYGMVDDKTDWDYPNTEFKLAGNTGKRRYFYRSFVGMEGEQASSPTAQWTSMITNADGTYFEQNMYDESGNVKGILTVMIESPQTGEFEIKDTSNTKVWYDHIGTGILWAADKDEVSRGAEGTVNVTAFDNTMGGTIEGLFSVTAVDSDNITNTEKKGLEGTFFAVRSTE